jgi:hypothetical protein
MDAIVERKLNEWLNTWSVGRQNRRDAVVIERLGRAPPGSLTIDKFAHVLCKETTPVGDDEILSLRDRLIRVYLNAATARLEAKAAKAQLSSSRKAAAVFTKGLNYLGNVRPPMLREFRPALEAAFGLLVDDPKGEHESNSFGAACQQIELAIVPRVMKLERLIQAEEAKEPGNRKKRLRVLVDFLADWWISETGRSVAPHVVANRRDDDTAVVHDRCGEFISLAVALFSKIDRFKESEIISAVTNMHKDHLAAQQNVNKTTQ